MPPCHTSLFCPFVGKPQLSQQLMPACVYTKLEDQIWHRLNYRDFTQKRNPAQVQLWTLSLLASIIMIKQSSIAFIEPGSMYVTNLSGIF
jgi:hypothetical protein